MTAWIALFAVTVLFALALRHSRPKEPPMPGGYDGERQLAELYALTASTNSRSPDSRTSRPDRRRRDHAGPAASRM